MVVLGMSGRGSTRDSLAAGAARQAAGAGDTRVSNLHPQNWPQDSWTWTKGEKGDKNPPKEMPLVEQMEEDQTVPSKYPQPRMHAM